MLFLSLQSLLSKPEENEVIQIMSMKEGCQQPPHREWKQQIVNVFYYSYKKSSRNTLLIVGQTTEN